MRSIIALMILGLALTQQPQNQFGRCLREIKGAYLGQVNAGQLAVNAFDLNFAKKFLRASADGIEAYQECEQVSEDDIQTWLAANTSDGVKQCVNATSAWISAINTARRTPSVNYNIAAVRATLEGILECWYPFGSNAGPDSNLNQFDACLREVKGSARGITSSLVPWFQGDYLEGTKLSLRAAANGIESFQQCERVSPSDIEQWFTLNTPQAGQDCWNAGRTWVGACIAAARSDAKQVELAALAATVDVVTECWYPFGRDPRRPPPNATKTPRAQLAMSA